MTAAGYVEEKETYSVWGPEYRGTAAVHPEKLAVWLLRGSQMIQSPSHPPPLTHHTSAKKYTKDTHTNTLFSLPYLTGSLRSTDATKHNYTVGIF